MSMYVPSVVNLFGPVDFGAALTEVLSGDVYHWPGSCDTSHIAIFQTEFGLPPLKYAVWRMCLSQPAGRSLFRLVTCNDGPSNLNPIGYIDTNNKPAGINVWNSPVDVTAPLNAWLTANPNCECNLGWQVAGDALNPFYVFACRLELLWDVTQKAP